MSSPHYPRSNGFIERHVRHVKPIIRKTIRNGEDIQITLLNLRATPIDTGLPSPAEMIFGRPIPTMLPQRGIPAPIEQRERFAQQQTNMKTHHDQSSRHVDVPHLYKGQKVRILDKTSKTWCPGTVLEKCQESRSYLVETPNGTRVRRIRSHLRDMTVQTRSVSFADEEVNAIIQIRTPNILRHIQRTMIHASCKMKVLRTLAKVGSHAQIIRLWMETCEGKVVESSDVHTVTTRE